MADPPPPPSKKKGGKDLVYIECILGLVSGFCRANQIHVRWFTCDYHVKPCYSYLLLCMRALIHCHAYTQYLIMPITWHTDIHVLCTPKSTPCIPDPFPPWEQGLGTRLVYSKKHITFKIEMYLSLFSTKSSVCVCVCARVGVIHSVCDSLTHTYTHT